MCDWHGAPKQMAPAASHATRSSKQLRGLPNRLTSRGLALFPDRRQRGRRSRGATDGLFKSRVTSTEEAGTTATATRRDPPTRLTQCRRWADKVLPKLSPLTWPRYPLLGLPEFGTAAALDHYNLRKRKAIGDFIELRANTRQHISALMPDLEELESPAAINGKLSLDDIRVLPLLRSAAVVKGLRFPKKIRDYFETMMSHIGYAALPTA
jgi:hypothetical protein